MKLSASRLAAVYTMLLSLPPFSRWKLPPAKGVRFTVVPHVHYDGYYSFNKKLKIPHTIGIAPYDTLASLVAVLAHEIVHLKEQIDGNVSGKAGDHFHSKKWRRLAASVCRNLGFESRGF